MTFQGYFQIIIFSSVMMHLNWSLPCVHSTKLINCKYVILFVTFPSIYRNFVGISRTWKCLVKYSYQCMKEIFLLKMKTHSCEKLIKYFAWKNYLGQSTGGNCLESNYVEVNYPGVITRDQFFWGSLLGGQLSWGAIVRGAIVLGPPIIFIKTHRKTPVLGSLY